MKIIPKFWARLTAFVSNVQVSDPMSEEEKEMILNVCGQMTNLQPVTDMPAKFEGIDERTVKCCDTAANTIQAGISFDTLEENNLYALRFHFLEHLDAGAGNVLHQTTRSMHLNAQNTAELIRHLSELNFEK